MTSRLVLWLTAGATIGGILIAPYIQPPIVLALITILIAAVLFLIRRTKEPAIALTVIALLYGAGFLSLFVFAGTLAIVVFGEVAARLAGDMMRPSLAYIAAASIGSVFVMVYLGHAAPLIPLMGVLVGVLLKSALQDRFDSLMIEHLGVAMTMFLFDELNFQVDLMLLFAAVIIAASLAYFSYRFKVADMSGLVSAAIVGIILIVFADVRWFLIMLAFLILGSACTRFRFERKIELGVAQSHGGVRGYFNVFANGLVGVAAAVLYGVFQNELFLALFLGSVASAAADTVASEIGVVGETPFLITTLERVPPGTNGGVTVVGEVAALGAATVVGMVALFLGVADVPLLIVCIAAGFVGTNVDSVVGATLENRGKIGNSGTNLVATLMGGLFAALFYL
ncbi:MAG: TIGR00297 family protein [Methanomicrobiaceae archaeon]|nr:TIGR00297 family protein [Methanomicrobiaceae archaeon]